VGRGSTFTVEMPAAPPSALRPAGPKLVERRGSNEGALSGMQVWVLDDDPDAHEVATLTLRQCGAAVQNAHSAAELAGMLEQALPAERPDVLLIDLAMPGEDGFGALRRVRSLEMALGAERYIPAIALTAFTQVERDKLLASGFADRVDKPIDADKLVFAIRSALQENRRGAMRAA
jgi:CheY-like chemotaxis protein